MWWRTCAEIRFFAVPPERSLAVVCRVAVMGRHDSDKQ